MSARRWQRFRRGLMVVFSLPFAAVGVFGGYLAVRQLAAWVDARQWVEVPARILEAELLEEMGSDSIVYRVRARYEYAVGDWTFKGERVWLASQADNLGSFHQDAHRELARYRDSGELFRCFVDPRSPTEAVLYRNLRWGLLAFKLAFALAFGGVGFTVLVASLLELRRSGSRSRRAPEGYGPGAIRP